MSTATQLAVDWTEQGLVSDAITRLDAAEAAALKLIFERADIGYAPSTSA
ncbi:MAG: hypothetical protein ACHBNF_12490 [Chromatiales bacterium]